MDSRQTVLSCACAALWFQPAVAQTQVQAKPADPRTEVSAPGYQSAFAGYRPFRDEKLLPWREVNDEVGRVGGQAGIFGGAGHAGHSGGNTVTNTPVPAAAKPQTPAHGPHHQGMNR